MYIDKNYHQLLEKVLTDGYEYEDPNRKGVIRKEIDSYNFKHDFKYGFPAISTKRLAIKGTFYELVQFLSGDTDITWLKEKGCTFWDKDVFSFDKFGNKNIGVNYPHQWINFGGIPEKIPIDRTQFFLNKQKINTVTHDIFKTKSYGDFIITGEHRKNKNKYFDIIFINTHTVSKVRKERIYGDLYDMYAPSILNIACLGDVLKYKKEKYYCLLLNIWKGMINRCYNEKNDNYEYYGGKGVFVNNRWKCFEYFYTDVQKLENWNLKIKEWDNFNLDKDIKTEGFEYSFETCMWISKSENSLKSKEKYNYTIKNTKTSEQLTFKNQALIIKQLNIKNQGNFASMLRDERSICENWILISKKKIKGINQIQNLIEGMINKPTSSELLVNSWNPVDLDKMSLPPCHYGFQIIMRPLTKEERQEELEKIYPQSEGTATPDDSWINFVPKYGFTLKWMQRSSDLFLGIPINIASYATLALILEAITGHKALGVEGNLSKVHLYDNSIEAAKEQLSRPCSEEIVKFDSSILTEYFEGYDPLKHDYDIFTATLLNIVDEFKLINYNPQPSIKVEMLERNENI